MLVSAHKSSARTGIIGESPALKSVLREVGIVAPTNATVLIHGETGTGKELIARSIHDLGSRRDQPFIKINCTAIPVGLLESELFGHERGAFTGAFARKLGRFELAHGGTLFLDEIGDIPCELQPKLLRVLQEHEFERLGSTRTCHVDVRIVAATCRDLPRMIADGNFRVDLYYRLKVFPIHVPALRNRREDIRLLVRHFVEKYAAEMNRCIEKVPPRLMEAIERYPWPGNIRELQNVIERAVILSTRSVLKFPLSELESPPPCTNGEAPASLTLEAAEREHIVHALRESHHIVGGSRGAAWRLGIKRTTLLSKMKKLGIARWA